MFAILAKGCSPFHLSALEATFIKTSNPILGRQKEFVYNLKICMFPLSCESTAQGFAVTLIDFLPITARLLYKYSAFSGLSILTILLDKCQTKSFEGNEHSTQSKLISIADKMRGVN